VASKRKKATPEETIAKLSSELGRLQGRGSIRVHVRGVTPEAVSAEPCTECDDVRPGYGPCSVITVVPVPKRKLM
jgi:hypothetical protein